MATRSYSRIIKVGNNPNNYTQENYSNTSSSSSSVGGHLILSPQAHSFVHAVSTGVGGWSKPGFVNPLPAGADQVAPPGLDWSKLDNAANARFSGKLRKGSVSMGINIAQYAQSRDMIVNRLGQLDKLIGTHAGRLEKSRAGRKRLQRKVLRKKELLANDVLELEFGVLPLLNDVHGALMTVCQEGVPPLWLSGRAKGRILSSTQQNSNPEIRQTWDGRMTVTVNAKVVVENPNVWLLNRLGLLNPAAVLWDAIPWSFVVNMFVNTNQIINSISDTVGLDVTGRNTTRSYAVIRESVVASPTFASANKTGGAFSNVFIKSRSRSVGSFPPVTVEFKIPNLNWELAIIAASLVVQKIKKLNNLIGI